MKKLVFVLCMLVVSFCLFAFTVDNSVSFGFFMPQNAFCAEDYVSFDFDITDSFFAGPYLGLGESICLYKTDSSKALIYGPVVELGLEAGKRFDVFSVGIKGGAKAVYSTFPIVLWFDSGVFGTYSICRNLCLECSFITLFWEDNLSFELETGVRFSL